MGGPLAEELGWRGYALDRRSILVAVALHFMTNATFSLVTGIGGALPADVAVVRSALHVALVVGVVAVWGPRRLRRDP